MQRPKARDKFGRTARPRAFAPHDREIVVRQAAFDLVDQLIKADMIAPLTMFKALRMQMDELDLTPDYTINGLSGLTQVLSAK